MLPTLGLTSKEIARVSNKILCEQPITEKEFEIFLSSGYSSFAVIKVNRKTNNDDNDNFKNIGKYLPICLITYITP